VPFLDRMGWVFLICVTVMVILGLALPDERKGLAIDAKMFKLEPIFAIGSAIVITALVILYTVFW
jgi:solute:Na+ symporter, SSS family